MPAEGYQVHSDRALPNQPMFNMPPVTKALLAANVLVFAAMLVLPARIDEIVVETFGFTPANYGGMSAFEWPMIVAPVTYQFVHAGFAHIGVNMLALVAFGAGIEQRLGGWRFLVFFLLSGIIGAFAEFAVAPGSADVVIGASAAISGLFGGILRFGVFRRGFWLLVALWLVMNAVTGIAGIGGAGEPVAWIAHVGGFAAGLILYPLFVRRAFVGH
jgi:membrane associated rhomboid family serine protease